MKMELYPTKIYEKQQKQFQKVVYSNTNLPQEIREMANKQSNLIPKGIRKIRTNEAQSYQKERNKNGQSRNKQRIKYNRKYQ